jgi:O-succinylbenzoate synthase
MHAQVTKKRKAKTTREANVPSFMEQAKEQASRQMTNVLANWSDTEEHEAALKASVARPGGVTRGKQKSEAADKWREPAGLFAKGIWQESPDLPIATVRQRIRKLLPEDKQPSDRALADHIRPLKPQK